MAVVFVCGAEIGWGGNASLRNAENVYSYTGTGSCTQDTGLVRKGGRASYAINSGASNVGPFLYGYTSVPINRTWYQCAWLYFDNLPSSQVRVFGFTDGSTSGVSFRVDQNGTLTTYREDTGALTATWDSTISTGVWYKFEQSATMNGSGYLTAFVSRINGTTLSTLSGVLHGSAAAACKMGWHNAPGANKVLHIDDVVAHDDTGSYNNSWPGNEVVACLLPASDNSVGTGWTRGGGTTTGLFNAVDNVPPVGVADPGTDSSQIRNAASNTNAYAANMQLFTDVGITANDKIVACVPCAYTGANATASLKAGSLTCSNPTLAKSTFNRSGTFGYATGVAGTFPTYWNGQYFIIDSPTIDMATTPVLTVTQDTASTQSAEVCFMGIMVVYTPSSPSSRYRLINQEALHSAALM